MLQDVGVEHIDGCANFEGQYLIDHRTEHDLKALSFDEADVRGGNEIVKFQQRVPPIDDRFLFKNVDGSRTRMTRLECSLQCTSL